MGFLDNLNWRYATKKFDGRKVPADVLEKILEAIRLAPTSFGLQSFRVLVIEDDTIRKELRTHAWDQEQLTSCSHLLIFCADLDISKNTKKHLKAADEAGVGGLGYDYGKEVADFAVQMGEDWLSRQTYILLGFAVAACAELKIDCCPMEAFDVSAFKMVLKLPDSLAPVSLLPIGYRSADDKHAFDAKIRVRREDLIESGI